MEKEFAKYTDGQLIDAIKDGDNSAFEWIVVRYENDIAKTVKGMLGNVAVADDVGQEVFLRFYHSMSKFRGDSSLKTYLTRIAINLSLNELKRRKTKRWLVFDNDYREIKSRSDVFKQKDINDLVQLALSQLETKFRSVLVLRLMQGYSTKETCEILNLPQGTVLSRMARGQEKLRQIVLNLEKTNSYE